MSRACFPLFIPRSHTVPFISHPQPCLRRGRLSRISSLAGFLSAKTSQPSGGWQLTVPRLALHKISIIKPADIQQHLISSLEEPSYKVVVDSSAALLLPRQPAASPISTCLLSALHERTSASSSEDATPIYTIFPLSIHTGNFNTLQALTISVVR